MYPRYEGGAFPSPADVCTGVDKVQKYDHLISGHGVAYDRQLRAIDSSATLLPPPGLS